jgi:hypothetical protein
MQEAIDIIGTPRAAAAVIGLRHERSLLMRAAMRAMWILIGVIVLAAAVAGGLKLRAWLWNQTTTIRFTGDIENAVYWGNQVLKNAHEIQVDAPPDSWRAHYEPLWKAFVGFYDSQLVKKHDREMHLDYAPLRLAVAALWADHINQLPGEKHNSWDNDAIEFMLRINTAMELLAAAAIFGLVFYWVRREDGDELAQIDAQRTRGSRRAWLLASLAGLLLWFDPAVLINAHVWPQWDIVAIAFFLLAALALSVDFCLTAGLVLAIGGMWKGQILMVAPLLVLWPIFEGQWRRSLRLLAGFAAGAGLLASPWLVPNRNGWIVVGACVLASAIASWWLFRSWRHRVALSAAVLGVSLFGVATWMGGSFTWFQTGFVFGADQWQAMHMGETINLPALLHRRWGWTLNDAVVVPQTMLTIGLWVKWTLNLLLLWGIAAIARRLYLRWGRHRATNIRKRGRLPLQLWLQCASVAIVWAVGIWTALKAGDAVAQMPPLTIKLLLQVIYAATLVLCAVGAARHSRRGSVGVLIALAAPWVLMFALVGQMHERYLMWGAAMTAAFVAVSFGMTLLHFLTTALAVVPMMLSLLPADRAFAPKWLYFIRGLYPDIGWLVLFLAAIYLYLALVNRPSRPVPEY